MPCAIGAAEAGPVLEVVLLGFLDAFQLIFVVDTLVPAPAFFLLLRADDRVSRLCRRVVFGLDRSFLIQVEPLIFVVVFVVKSHGLFSDKF
jgi:hypothetical protein